MTRNRTTAARNIKPGDFIWVYGLLAEVESAYTYAVLSGTWAELDVRYLAPGHPEGATRELIRLHPDDRVFKEAHP